jgi:hypothetical protein
MGMIKRDYGEMVMESADNIAESFYGEEFEKLPAAIQNKIWNRAEMDVINDRILSAEGRHFTDAVPSAQFLELAGLR